MPKIPKKLAKKYFRSSAHFTEQSVHSKQLNLQNKIDKITIIKSIDNTFAEQCCFNVPHWQQRATSC